jgi:hypothetical protein
MCLIFSAALTHNGHVLFERGVAMTVSRILNGTNQPRLPDEPLAAAGPSPQAGPASGAAPSTNTPHTLAARMLTAPVEPLLVDARTAAAMLGIGQKTLWSKTKAGEIAHVPIGARGVRYAVDDLRAWIERTRQRGGRPEMSCDELAEHTARAAKAARVREGRKRHKDTRN